MVILYQSLQCTLHSVLTSMQMKRCEKTKAAPNYIKQPAVLYLFTATCSSPQHPTALRCKKGQNTSTLLHIRYDTCYYYTHHFLYFSNCNNQLAIIALSGICDCLLIALLWQNQFKITNKAKNFLLVCRNIFMRKGGAIFTNLQLWPCIISTAQLY